MAPARILRQLLDLLSSCGIGLLMLYGVQTAFPTPAGWMLVTQNHWLGYWVMASSVTLAVRMRATSKKEGIAGGEHPSS
jgi:hypothetical protein